MYRSGVRADNVAMIPTTNVGEETPLNYIVPNAVENGLLIGAPLQAEGPSNK